jgi:hypothetical protein
MTLVKHTPGPWVFGWYAKGAEPPLDWRYEATQVIFGNKKHLSNGRQGDIAYMCNDLGQKNVQRIADARLIVSAPELLNALKMCIDALGCKHPSQDEYWDAWRAGDAAIKKAEGETIS